MIKGVRLIAVYDIVGNRGLIAEKHVRDASGGSQLGNLQHKLKQRNVDLSRERSMEIIEPKMPRASKGPRKNGRINRMGIPK